MTRRLLLAPMLSLALFASGCASFQAVPAAERRAIVLSFDGAGERVIERMLERGVMPNLARMRAEGAMADYSQTNFPSKTAAGHAALWTGAFGNVNGITSNKVPAMPQSAHAITETLDGFSSESLIAEPFFVTAARAGKRALVLQATHEVPFSPYAPGGRFGTGISGSLTLLDGYSGVRLGEGHFKDAKAFKPATGWVVSLPPSVRPAQELALTIGESTVWAVAVDDPADGVQGYDTLALYGAKSGPLLGEIKPAGDRLGRPEGWSGALPIRTAKGPGSVFLRLYDLDARLDRVLIYHTPVAEGRSNKPEQAARYYGEGSAFVSSGAIRSWEAGAFGPTMFEGGAGAAEDRYLDTVAFVIETYRKRLRLALAAKDWDLAVSYLPFPDEALHSWYGAVDDQSPSYDAAKAPVAWRRLEQVCRLADGYLGTVLEGAGRNTVVAVASDHGMAGLKWTFHPNVLLRQAGLLTLDARGGIDLKKTRVIYAPTDGGYLLVNRAGRQGGIVAAADVPGVLESARSVLAKARAHDGTPLITEFVIPDAASQSTLGFGGLQGGDMYLDLRPGYYFDSDWKRADMFKTLDAGSAGHVFDPRRGDMHAIQAYWGPGLKRGVSLPAVRNIDLAPTICRLLGLPAPAQATGRVIEEALE